MAKKEKSIVLTPRQAATMVDALMVCYGFIVDQIPHDEVTKLVAEMRQEIFGRIKEQENGK